MISTRLDNKIPSWARQCIEKGLSARRKNRRAYLHAIDCLFKYATEAQLHRKLRSESEVDTFLEVPTGFKRDRLLYVHMLQEDIDRWSATAWVNHFYRYWKPFLIVEKVTKDRLFRELVRYKKYRYNFSYAKASLSSHIKLFEQLMSRNRVDWMLKGRLYPLIFPTNSGDSFFVYNQWAINWVYSKVSEGILPEYYKKASIQFSLKELRSDLRTLAYSRAQYNQTLCYVHPIDNTGRTLAIYVSSSSNKTILSVIGKKEELHREYTNFIDRANLTTTGDVILNILGVSCREINEILCRRVLLEDEESI